MFFLWPQYLWFLLALPLLPAAYVWPSRLEAAQEAAKLFLRDLPRQVEVGLGSGESPERLQSWLRPEP